MTKYVFTALEKQELEAARLLCPPGNNPSNVDYNGNWVPFYTKLSQIIGRHISLGDVTDTRDLSDFKSAKLWLDVAIGANGGTGMHSAFIRTYTNREGANKGVRIKGSDSIYSKILPMARLPRYIIPGQPQHIIQRGNNRQAIFASDEDFAFFRDALVEAAGRFGLEVHAYVWMTNHIHLLATPGREDSIGKTLQSVGRRYVAYFNARQQRTGTLWEGRYRSTVVDTSRYFIALMRYIEQNPVRAGMVAGAGDYTWSSHRRYAMGVQDANTAWLVPHAEWAALGLSSYERQESYRALFAAPTNVQELEQIRQSTHKGWALGDAAFAQWVEQQTDRPAASKGIGRPRSIETKEKMESDPIKR